MRVNVPQLRKHLNSLRIDSCSIAAGGSLSRDIDLIYVADNIRYDDVRAIKTTTEAKFNMPVSVCPFTPMMFRTGAITCKIATMLFKGVIWLKNDNERFFHISYDQMRKITIRNGPEELASLVRVAGEGKKDKVIDLLVQMTSILLGGNDGKGIDSDKANVPFRAARAEGVSLESALRCSEYMDN